MPTPIGHGLAGLAVAGVFRRSGDLSQVQVSTLAFLAAAPDLDLVLRLVDGANHHRGPSHSLGAALVAGLAAWALRRLGIDWLPGSLAAALAWASHVALDYLGLDTSPPVGEMALWPLSNSFFASPVSVFYDVPRSFSAEAIQHNILAVTIEIAILGPVAFVCLRRRDPRG